MNLNTMSTDQLNVELAQLEAEFSAYKAAGLNLDITRGKPSIAQLDLSSALDGVLGGDFIASDGTDVRGYGGLDGLPEAKAMGCTINGIVAAAGSGRREFQSQLNVFVLNALRTLRSGRGWWGMARL